MKLMDDGIGNIVYILLTLLFVIIGLVGKKKPVQAPAAMANSDNGDPMEEDATESDLFKGLNSLFDDISVKEDVVSEQMQSVEYQDDYEYYDKLDSPESKLDNPDNPLDSVDIENSLENQIEHIETIPDFIKLTEMGSAHENMDLSEVHNTFITELDIEKAIVYSEIINPKYF